MFVALMESEHYQRYFLEEVSRQLEGALHCAFCLFIRAPRT